MNTRRIDRTAVNMPKLIEELRLIGLDGVTISEDEGIELMTRDDVPGSRVDALAAAVLAHDPLQKTVEQERKEAEEAERTAFKQNVASILEKVAAAIPNPDTVKDVKELAQMVKDTAEVTRTLVKLMNQLLERVG
jgi:rRNA maturation endonuclease Nob1